MTGYGKTLVELNDCNIEVEIKSVNHKYCIVKPKLPPSMQLFEHKIVSLIKSRFSRGSFDIVITIDQTGEMKPNFKVDITRINQLIDELEEVRNKFRIRDELSFATLALFKDLFLEKTEGEYEIEKLWDGVSIGISRACDRLLEMRKIEGANLEKDIINRLGKLKNSTFLIEKETRDLLIDARAKLQEKINSILGNNMPEMERMNQEIVLLVEKSDITEELTRLNSHIEQSFSIIKNEESPGRKLEFLMQEILREANTISAKVSNASISQRVVEIKVEIEKIREQLLNVE